jgi:predicted dienelactone hydrolase
MKHATMKRGARALRLAIVFSATVGLGTAVAADPPGATGPWGVGHRQLASVDASRGDRPLPLEVWYPVDAADVAGPFTKYILAGPLGLTSTLAHEGAVVSSAGTRPLVVFSHGSGGIAIQSIHLMEQLASHGFVVVAPNHTGNTNADFTGGTAVPIAQALLDRVPDVSFVIDHMTALAAIPGEPFFGRLDGQNVGVAGHSLGGFTALAVKSGYQSIPPDTRVRAIMPIAPAASSLADAELAGITVPTLFMTGTLDGLLAQEIRAAGLIQSGPFNYRADVIGATHTHFANICDIANALIAVGLVPSTWPSIGAGALVGPYNATCIPPAFSIEEATRLENLYATAFFRRHLLGEASYDEFLVTGYAEDNEPAVTFVRSAGPYYAVRGRRMTVIDPTNVVGRGVVVQASELPTDLGPILGDPTVRGATLRVVVRGAEADETFVLDRAGWIARGAAYRYTGPTTGDPVRKAVLLRSAHGIRLVIALSGRVGPLAIGVPAGYPPGLPQDGEIELAIGGGGTYCAPFGGAAGGQVTSGPHRWTVREPSSDVGCPFP